jgi:hypothetical protein
MIKLATLLPLNECVVTSLRVDGNVILAKNRDRKYDPTVEVVHEIVNGIELVFIHDTITDWSEGMNEKGIGIVNASLLVEFDEKEGDLAKDKDKKGVVPSDDGQKIRKALSYPKLSESIRSVITFVGNDRRNVGIKGHTIIGNASHVFNIEMTSKHLPIIAEIGADDIFVRTNHGIDYPDTGYTSGIKRASSVSRMNLAKDALKQVTTVDQVLPALEKQYNKDTFMNPYRLDNQFQMNTTGQVMMNLTTKEFYYMYDTRHSKFNGYVNKLPEGYSPKIRVHIRQVPLLQPGE